VYIATALGDLLRLDGAAATPLTGALAAPWAGIGGGAGTNAPGADLALVPLATARANRAQVIDVLLGRVPATGADVQHDLNLDGVVDAADLFRAAE
jgi:hypothetical protein